MITEPRWKSYIVETTSPIFTPEQCKMIIQAGRAEPRNDAQVGNEQGIKSGHVDTSTRTSHISWIPFSKMDGMYKDLDKIMQATNRNHFGFEGMTINEMAQYTEYPEGGFYEWHVDNDVNCQHEPPVRKISMTLLLSPESEFEGGETEFLYQKCRFKPEKNTLLVWPSQFTHIHRGNPPLSNDKYIITGWIEYGY